MLLLLLLCEVGNALPQGQKWEVDMEKQAKKSDMKIDKLEKKLAKYRQYLEVRWCLSVAMQVLVDKVHVGFFCYFCRNCRKKTMQPRCQRKQQGNVQELGVQCGGFSSLTCVLVWGTLNVLLQNRLRQVASVHQTKRNKTF